ncbi:uncharacterized protein LOC129592319 [Paramacrobiotus metropolitanus]|uniref:uncharacterized protein LOC129592319 n=1 Tax=Paramacrobiotus metropolitanus TaxID=2943436 RepID=UPI002445B701|nr:uncharacterized protein LOC129592319 [Paramacrobiotus metropolitanus]
MAALPLFLVIFGMGWVTQIATVVTEEIFGIEYVCMYYSDIHAECRNHCSKINDETVVNKIRRRRVSKDIIPDWELVNSTVDPLYFVNCSGIPTSSQWKNPHFAFVAKLAPPNKISYLGTCLFYNNIRRTYTCGAVSFDNKAGVINAFGSGRWTETSNKKNPYWSKVGNGIQFLDED